MNIVSGITGFILCLWTWVIIGNLSKGRDIPQWATALHAIAFGVFVFTL